MTNFFWSFVSVIHLFVGVVYCLVSWSVGLPKRAVSSTFFIFFHHYIFSLGYYLGPLAHSLSCLCCMYLTCVCVYFRDDLSQPINSDILKVLIPVAVCHAIGHVTSNVSFAAVAVSFTHTIKGISASCKTHLILIYT